MGIGSRRFHQTTVHKSRVESCLRINHRNHRRSRRFTMRTCNRNSMTKTHNLRQHLRPLNHRDPRLTRRNDFRIIGFNRTGHHHHAGLFNICRFVFEKNLGTELAQTLSHRTVGNIRTGHHIAFIQQHFGDSAHPCTADTDKMNLLYPAHSRYKISQTFVKIVLFHLIILFFIFLFSYLLFSYLLPSSLLPVLYYLALCYLATLIIISATRSAACGFAMFLAVSAMAANLLRSNCCKSAVIRSAVNSTCGTTIAAPTSAK